MGQIRTIKRAMNTKGAQRIKTVEEAYKEGLAKGYHLAIRDLRKGIDEAVSIFLERLSTVDQIPDIGPKRYQNILNHFGYLDKEELQVEEQKDKGE